MANWIQGAIKKPGSFSAAAKRAGQSTASFARAKENAPGKMGQRARLAETLMGMNKARGGLPGMDKPADTPAQEASERKRGIAT